jgi:hypothetical protein
VVCAFVAHESNAGDFAAGVDLDADRLQFAPDAVLQAKREWIALVYDRPPAFEKKAGPPLAARHQRFLALIHCQLWCSEEAITGLVAPPLRAISPRQCCRPAFEQNPLRAYPRRVCGPAFQSLELRKHSKVGLEPVCNVASARSPTLTLVKPGFSPFRVKSRRLRRRMVCVTRPSSPPRHPCRDPEPDIARPSPSAARRRPSRARHPRVRC